MADTTFVPGTVITSAWLQDINDMSYGLQSTAANKGANLVAYNFSLTPVAGSVAAALQNPKLKQSADYAVIGTNEILTNGGFTGSTSGWTLTNFSYATNAISHSAGTVGTVSQNITLSAYTHYKLAVTLTTTTRGGIDFQIGGVTMLDDTGYYTFDPSTNTYSFPFLNGATTSTTFSIVTNTLWAGTIDSVSLVKITSEMPMTVTSVPTDDPLERIPNCIKFGRYNAGVLAMGDRQTMAFAGAPAVWNVAIGPRTLQGNESGMENTVGGAFSGRYTSTSRNTMWGYSVAKYNTLGYHLSGFGFKALGSNTTGIRNDGYGFHTLLQNTCGNDNLAAGWQSLYNILNTSGNTGVGSQTGMNGRGTQNTYLGALAGYLNADVNITFSYSFGVSIGSQAKVYGENGTAVGFNARVGAEGAPVDNALALGSEVVNLKANSAKIGNAHTTANISGRTFFRHPLASVTVGANTSYTAGQFTESVVLTRSGPGAPFSDTSPTAAEIIAAIPGCEVGTGYSLYLRNITGSTLTLLAGTGVTLAGTTTVAGGQCRHYIIQATNVGTGTEAVTIVGVSTASI